MSLPPNWATLVQPPPRNHGTPAIDALRPGQPLRELVGEMLADAAIERAAQGEKTYGSKLTPNNGRDQAIDAMQELADAAAYLAAWTMELGRRNRVERALIHIAARHIWQASEAINKAAEWRAKRLAKAKGEGK